ncbi:MAG: hypothetical protein R3211_08465 [Balneolaceae bacterium]|nr:hypothetical protein [Balneolaceae bacterium]
MNEKERKKLIEQKEKELLFDVNRDLRIEQHKKDIEEVKEQFENRYIKSAIILFVTVGILYILIFMGKYIIVKSAAFAGLRVDTGWIEPLLHAFIWSAGVFSVIKQKSILDILIEKYY